MSTDPEQVEGEQVEKEGERKRDKVEEFLYALFFRIP